MADLTQPTDTVLRLLREERPFRADLSTAADVIVDKIYSYYTNPNCTCKGAIVDWIGKNTDTVNTLLAKHKDAVAAMTTEVAKATEVAAAAAKTNPSAPQPNNPAALLANPKAKFGAVIDIERDPEAYKTLIHTAMTEGWIYRGCTVVPDVVDGKAVWSVFFF
jgi:hypothetical protein